MLTQRLFLVVLSLLAFASAGTGTKKYAVSLQRSLQQDTTDIDLEHNDTSIVEEDAHDHEDDHDHDHDHEETTSESNLLQDGTATSKPWGEAILASFLINVVTLVGVFFLSGEFVAKRVFKRDIAQSPYYHAFTRNVIPSFACGALLATTLFLVLPEALHLISAHFMGDEASHGHRRSLEEEDHNGEAQATWRFGACVITGFLLPILTDTFFPQHHKPIGSLEDKQEGGKDKDSRRAENETEHLREIPGDGSVGDEPHNEITSDVLPSDNKVTCDYTNKSVASEEDDADVVVVVGDKVLRHSIDWSLTLSIFAGDFFHNFAGTRVSMLMMMMNGSLHCQSLSGVSF
jgi:hypothetical protein